MSSIEKNSNGTDSISIDISAEAGKIADAAAGAGTTPPASIKQGKFLPVAAGKGGVGRSMVAPWRLTGCSSRPDRIQLTLRSAIFLVSSQIRSAPETNRTSTTFINEWRFYD